MENDLKFSGQSPVIINYNGSTDDIYAPIKTSSCDITIVDEHILDDLYTAKKDEIYVKIEKKEPAKIREIRFSSNGSASSIEMDTPGGDDYVFKQITQFFYDNLGNFYFVGQIGYEDTYDDDETVNLKYNYQTNRWERDYTWNLDLTDTYFLDDSNTPHRVSYNGSIHMVQRWTGNSWGTPSPYKKMIADVDSDCAWGGNYVVQYMNGDVELLFNHYRAIWDDYNTRWGPQNSYTDIDGGTYDYLNGDTHFVAKLGDGTLCDAAIVTGYQNSDTDVSTWVVALSKSNAKFKKIVPIKVLGLQNTSNFFNGADGSMYYITPSGDIYVWSWDVNSWVKWITFTGDYTQGTFDLDYVIKGGNNNIVIIKYIYNNEYKYFNLSNMVPPVCYWVEIPVPGEYTTTTIWDGYKMPNTYSQDVTQNLDLIEMTAIDPLSILKWVTIDYIFDKPNVRTYGEILGKALAYIQPEEDTELWVERVVTYGSSTYTGDNGLLDLQLQVANFWNEDGDAATLYEVIEEMLRPFCLTLTYVNNSFQIYDGNKNYARTFDKYTIDYMGVLQPLESNVGEDKILYDFNEGDWISNNTQDATVDIDTTYDKVTAVANTCKPTYSRMVSDVISYSDNNIYSDTKAYDIQWFNVQRNKTKGYEYKKGSTPNYKLRNDDQWFFIWNGAYADEDYELIPYPLSGDDWTLDGWVNINNAYQYYYGTAGHDDRYGSIFNYYGGSNNPTGTGKASDEKSVELDGRITKYHWDNGRVPEFLEDSALVWAYYDARPTIPVTSDPTLTKYNKTNSIYGHSNPGIAEYPRTLDTTYRDTELAYKQEYDNITLRSGNNEQAVDFRLTQAYSRTGINTPVDVMMTSNAYNKLFSLVWNGSKYQAFLKEADVEIFPDFWNSEKMYVDNVTFSEKSPAGENNNQILPVWDRRLVNMYVTYTDGGVDHYYQFNGREWVDVTLTGPEDMHGFYLLKLMNYNKLFHTDYQYNIIQFASYIDSNNNEYPIWDTTHVSASQRDSVTFSLEDEDVVYYTKSNGVVARNPKNSDTQHKYTPYGNEDNTWYKWIKSCAPGELSIALPDIDATNTKLVVEVSCSSWLGHAPAAWTHPGNVYVITTVDGEGEYQGTAGIPLTPSNCENYGQVIVKEVPTDFVPANTFYIKAEHLDLNISVSTPESNIGKMFKESDIRYTISNGNGYLEKYTDLNFKVNTKNRIVYDSYSYILYGGQLADPGSFVVNGFSVRPEGFTLQAYMNWLGKVRKIYSKTIKPIKVYDYHFSPIRTFITAPEICENEYHQECLVVSDSWDVKTNRHTIKAVENELMEVMNVNPFEALEIPRMARADRWNLPTAYNL